MQVYKSTKNINNKGGKIIYIHNQQLRDTQNKKLQTLNAEKEIRIKYKPHGGHTHTHTYM